MIEKRDQKSRERERRQHSHDDATNATDAASGEYFVWTVAKQSLLPGSNDDGEEATTTFSGRAEHYLRFQMQHLQIGNGLAGT